MYRGFVHETLNDGRSCSKCQFPNTLSQLGLTLQVKIAHRLERLLLLSCHMLHQKTHHPGMLHSRLHRPTVSNCLAVNIDRGLRMSNERNSYHQPSLDWPKRRPFEQPMTLLISLQLFAISGGGELSGAHSSQAWSLTNATGFNLYLDAEAQDGQLQRGSSCIGPDGQQRPGIKEVGEESTKESLKACLLRRQNTEVESRKAVLQNSHMKRVYMRLSCFKSPGALHVLPKSRRCKAGVAKLSSVSLLRFSKMAAVIPIETQLYRKAQQDHPEALRISSLTMCRGFCPSQCKCGISSVRGRACEMQGARHQSETQPT